MYGLSVGISHVGESLPDPVYALLSGLNAATVGIIALAAVGLAERAITDKLTRILVLLGGALGMLYTSLWYYPVLMLGAGLTTMTWDLRWPHQILGTLRGRVTRRKKRKTGVTEMEEGSSPSDSQLHSWIEKPLPLTPLMSQSSLPEINQKPIPLRNRPVALSKFAIFPAAKTSSHPLSANSNATSFPPRPSNPSKPTRIPTLLSWPLSALLLTLFFVSFLPLLILRSHLPPLLSIFTSLYTAGTLVFGGGPVIIPLLRSSFAPDIISPRDFLLGLAIIQSFPGPNFNFAIYLGALAVKSQGTTGAVGALVAFVAIFTPGLVVVLAVMGLWRFVDGRKWFLASLRGVNAAAVGLVFTAVWKLWEMGLVGKGGAKDGGGPMGNIGQGAPLGGDPWLVAITAGAFVGGKWFGMAPPVAILLGGVCGVVRWAVFEK